MSKVIEVPGMGNVEFPDNMSDESISAAIKKNMPKAQSFDAIAAAAPKAGQYTPPQPEDQRNPFQRFAQTLGANNPLGMKQAPEEGSQPRSVIDMLKDLNPIQKPQFITEAQKGNFPEYLGSLLGMTTSPGGPKEGMVLPKVQSPVTTGPALVPRNITMPAVVGAAANGAHALKGAAIGAGLGELTHQLSKLRFQDPLLSPPEPPQSLTPATPQQAPPQGLYFTPPKPSTESIGIPATKAIGTGNYPGPRTTTNIPTGVPPQRNPLWQGLTEPQPKTNYDVVKNAAIEAAQQIQSNKQVYKAAIKELESRIKDMGTKASAVKNSLADQRATLQSKLDSLK